MYKVISSLLFCCFVFEVKAQHLEHTNADFHRLDSIEISTIFRQNQAEKNTPWNLNHVDIEKESNKFSSTLPDAISLMPGVLMQRTNLGGGSPFINGLTGNQILMLIDGIRMNNAVYRYGPNQYLNTVDLFSLGRVEIASGTGSVQYGSDALGGVVHLMSKMPKFKISPKMIHDFSGRGKFITGLQEGTLNLRVEGMNQNKAYAINGTIRKFGDVVGPKSIGTQTPSGYKEYSINSMVRFRDLTGEWIMNSQLVSQFNVPVYHKYQLENFALNEMFLQFRNLNYIRRIQKIGKQNLSELQTTLGYIQCIEDRNIQKNFSQVKRIESDKVGTYFGTMQFSKKLKRGIAINSGIEFYLDKVGSTRSELNLANGNVAVLRGLYPNNSQFQQNSIFFLMHKEISNWNVYGGMRYHFSKIDIQEKSLGSIHDNTNAMVYNFGVLRSVSKSLSLYLNYNTGFRAPNIDDLGTLGIVDFRYEVPQYNLDPEYTKTTEIGLKYTKVNTKLRLNLYYTNIQGQIARIKLSDSIQGYPLYQKENVENSELYGMNFSFTQNIGAKWNLDMGGSICIGNNITRNEPMRRIPPINGFVKVTSILNHMWQLNLDFQIVNEQRRLASGDIVDNRIGINGTKSYAIANIGATYKSSKYMVVIGIVNVFDAVAKVHGSGILLPGRCCQIQLVF